MMLPILPIFATLVNLAEINNALRMDFHDGERFAVTCTVIDVSQVRDSSLGVTSTSYFAVDASGYGMLRTTESFRPSDVRRGDVAEMSGRLAFERHGWPKVYVDALKPLGHGSIPPPKPISATQLKSDAYANQSVVMSGTLMDIGPDEIDPRYIMLNMRSGDGAFLVSVPAGYVPPADTLRPGAKLSIQGQASSFPMGGKRRFWNPMLYVYARGCIHIDTPAPEDPFSVPDVGELKFMSAAAISGQNRHKAEGRLIAVFGKRQILLKTDSGQIVRAEIKEAPLPKNGAYITVTGFPETDLFVVNLSKAIWKPLPSGTEKEDAPRAITADEILSGPHGKHQILTEHYGRLIRMKGRLLNLPHAHGDEGMLNLACGEHLVPVDLSACEGGISGMEPGCMVEVTGVCVMNTGNWRPSDLFPDINGFTLVPRGTSDISILSRPPWWTVRRLAAIIAVLVAVLLAILLWNGVLRIMIERRSRQLFKTEVATVKANLRIDERTRLAVELHDAMAQTLTGISFQIDAAGKTLPSSVGAAAGYLKVAQRMLGSCREELRRCLWDLRNHALEETNFAKALRMTLHPCIGDVEVAIDFDVSREQLSDSTAHNILCIIRELCVNSVRHGKARHIWIAGERRKESVKFSVRDDGCGFDPAAYPGPSQGHFGLQGVKERINRMGGSLTVDSVPGKGTRITVEIGR